MNCCCRVLFQNCHIAFWNHVDHSACRQIIMKQHHPKILSYSLHHRPVTSNDHTNSCYFFSGNYTYFCLASTTASMGSSVEVDWRFAGWFFERFSSFCRMQGFGTEAGLFFFFLFFRFRRLTSSKSHWDTCSFVYRLSVFPGIWTISRSGGAREQYS